MSNAVTDGTTPEPQTAAAIPGVPDAPTPRRIPVDVEWADIAKGHGDVYVVGHYMGIVPQYAEWALDCALSGTTDPSKLVLTDLTRRGAIRGALGDVIFFPMGGGKQAVLAGMGRPGAFKEALLKTLVRTTIETICRVVPNPTICMVLIGSGYGTLKVEEAVSGLIAGLNEALTSNPQLPLQRLRIVERNLDRAYEILALLTKTAKAAGDGAIDVEPEVIEEDKDGGVIPLPFGLSMILASLAQACHEGAGSPLHDTVESLLVKLPEHLQTPVRVVLKRLGRDQNSRRLGLAFRLGQDSNLGDRDNPNRAQNGLAGRADRVSYSHDGSALLRAAAITNLATVPERDLDLQISWVDRIVDDLYAALPDGLEERSTRAYRYLVHQDLNEKLADRDEPLIVEVDRTMARVPWEMICEGPGKDPIGLKRQLARQLRTSYSPRISDRGDRRTFRALVIGNPDDSLPYAEKEATEVHAILKDKIKNVDVELRLGAPDELGLGRVPGVKAADLFEIIALLLDGTFDFVHYAGHAVFDPAYPDRSGWLFAGGQILTPSKLANIADVPRLIFANACLSGGLSRVKATAPKGRKSRRSIPADDAKRRTAAQGDSRLVASLADEFFRRGVADYIGTAWEVPEGPAELFAVTFYETLLANQSSPVSLGKAILTARTALRKSQKDWRPELQSTWAAYQHYGDPTRSLWD